MLVVNFFYATINYKLFYSVVLEWSLETWKKPTQYENWKWLFWCFLSNGLSWKIICLLYVLMNPTHRYCAVHWGREVVTSGYTLLNWSFKIKMFKSIWNWIKTFKHFQKSRVCLYFLNIPYIFAYITYKYSNVVAHYGVCWALPIPNT